METSKNIPSINKTEQALGQRSAHGKKRLFIWAQSFPICILYTQSTLAGIKWYLQEIKKKKKGEIKFVLLLKKGQDNRPALQLVIARCPFLSTLKSGGTCSFTRNYRIRGHTAKPQYWHLVLEK